MTNGLYPGGLAVIIRAIDKENIGKTVVLVEKLNGHSIRVGDHVFYRSTKSESWMVSHANGELLAKTSDDGEVNYHAAVLYAEHCLMPLSGDFSHETEKEELVNEY